jgi:hypothetical protein
MIPSTTMRTHNKNMQTTPEKILQQMEMLTGKRRKKKLEKIPACSETNK